MKTIAPVLKICQVYARFVLLEQLENNGDVQPALTTLDLISQAKIETELKHAAVTQLHRLIKECQGNMDKCQKDGNPTVTQIRMLQHSLEKFESKHEALTKKHPHSISTRPLTRPAKK